MGRQRDPRRRRRPAGIAEVPPTVNTMASDTEPTTTARAAFGIGRLRWTARPERHRSRCRPGRAVGGARPQRSRQDHVVQRGGRRHPTHLRHRFTSTVSTAPCCRRVADRDSAWRAPISARACSPGSPSRTTSISPSSAGKVATDRSGVPRSTSSGGSGHATRARPSGSATASSPSSATCPTANSVNSRWAWRWSPTHV